MNVETLFLVSSSLSYCVQNRLSFCFGHDTKKGNLHSTSIYVLSRVLVNVVTSVRNNGQYDTLFHFSGWEIGCEDWIKVLNLNC